MNIDKSKKQLVEELDEKRLQLEAILDYSPTLISIKDSQGTVLLVNRNFQTLKGPSPEEYIGKNVYDLFPFDVADALWKNDQIVFRSKKAIETEEVVQHNDGSWHTYLTNKFPLIGRNKKLFGVCAISTDISQRKLLEEQLAKTLADARQAERLAKLGTYE